MSPIFSLQSDLKIALGIIAIVAFGHAVSTGLWTVKAIGPREALGNRDAAPAEAAWGLRLRKAWRNFLENIAIFFALVLAAMAGGVSEAGVGVGALLFAVARAVYLPIYAIGVPVVRTLAWAAGAVGLVMMAVAVFA